MLTSCIVTLSGSITYRRVSHYPTKEIKKCVKEKFCPKFTTPYIHMTNDYARFCSQTKQITKLLISMAFPRYINSLKKSHNSTALSIILNDLHVFEDTILVSIDVESLHPSIPQTECLQIIYNEMHTYRHLLLFESKLIIQLLQLCINFNYFEFASLYFQ